MEEEESETSITLKVSVADEDKGKVIGKDGKIAKALRTVTKAASRNVPKSVYVDIVLMKSFEIGRALDFAE